MARGEKQAVSQGKYSIDCPVLLCCPRHRFQELPGERKPADPTGYSRPVNAHSWRAALLIRLQRLPLPPRNSLLGWPHKSRGPNCHLQVPNRLLLRLKLHTFDSIALTGQYGGVINVCRQAQISTHPAGAPISTASLGMRSCAGRRPNDPNRRAATEAETSTLLRVREAAHKPYKPQAAALSEETNYQLDSFFRALARSRQEIPAHVPLPALLPAFEKVVRCVSCHDAFCGDGRRANR